MLYSDCQSIRYMGRVERGEVNITLDKLYGLCAVPQYEAADLPPPRGEVGGQDGT